MLCEMQASKENDQQLVCWGPVTGTSLQTLKSFGFQLWLLLQPAETLINALRILKDS